MTTFADDVQRCFHEHGDMHAEIRRLKSENALLKREVLAASVTVQIGRQEWVTVPAIKDEINNMRLALEKIARGGCKSFTTGIGSCYRNGRLEDVEFVADQCCHPCIAYRASLGFT